MKKLALALLGLVPFGLFAADAAAAPPPWANSRAHREARSHNDQRRADRHDGYRYNGYRHGGSRDWGTGWRHYDGYRSYRPYYPYRHYPARSGVYVDPGAGFGGYSPGFSFWLRR